MEYPKYQKIPGPFKRAIDGPNRNKVIIGEYTSTELEYLSGLLWLWTEKVDGTNIRINWDGHKVVYGGRTDNAQLSVRLIQALDKLFTEELFEQAFGETEVTLFGEGYGAGIQKGGAYRPDVSFVLFDIRIGEYYLLRCDVEEIGTAMGLEVVPVVLRGSLWDAILTIQEGFKSTWNEEHIAEGLVGTTPMGLLNRHGQRLIIKVKAADFA
jgi:hypothetical protein